MQHDMRRKAHPPAPPMIKRIGASMPRSETGFAFVVLLAGGGGGESGGEATGVAAPPEADAVTPEADAVMPEL
jgi:hypothetical protein